MDAYQTIWEEMPLLEAYQPLLESRPDLKTVLVWVYQDILDFHREALCYFRHSGTLHRVFEPLLMGLADIL